MANDVTTVFLQQHPMFIGFQLEERWWNALKAIAQRQDKSPEDAARYLFYSGLCDVFAVAKTYAPEGDPIHELEAP